MKIGTRIKARDDIRLLNVTVPMGSVGYVAQAVGLCKALLVSSGNSICVRFPDSPWTKQFVCDPKEVEVLP